MVVYKALNTTRERTTTYAGHGAGDGYAGKAGASIERIVTYAGHRAGDDCILATRH